MYVYVSRPKIAGAYLNMESARSYINSPFKAR